MTKSPCLRAGDARGGGRGIGYCFFARGEELASTLGKEARMTAMRELVAFRQWLSSSAGRSGSGRSRDGRTERKQRGTANVCMPTGEP